MSNDPKQQTQTAPPRTVEKRDSIPVAVLKFDDRYPVAIPGTTKTAVTAMAHDKVFDEKGKRVFLGPCWVIDFLPAIRHHRIVHFSSDMKPPQVVMVHESHVRSWEPLPL